MFIYTLVILDKNIKMENFSNSFPLKEHLQALDIKLFIYTCVYTNQ